ncbi:MAG: hypothetical protein KDD53_03935, partial [Bdellovibrionales bacterium]|nr:hypothetical protein [Bdellovibrionales bacterium]
MHSSITEVSADFRSDHSDIPSGVTRRGFVTAAATLFAFPRIAEGQEPSQALTPGELKSVIELVNANYARSINFAGPYQERTSQFDEGLLEISRYIDWIRDEAKRNGAAGICNIADSDFSSRRESMRQNLWDALLLCDFPGTSGRYESGKLNRFFFQTLPEVCAQFGIVPLVGAVPIGDKESGKIVHFDPMMSFLIIDRTEWAVVADLSFKDTPVRAIITKGSVGSQGTSFADSFAAFTLYDTIFIDQDSLVNLENLATLPLSSLHPPELIELERQAGPDVAPINIALRFVSIVDDSEKYQASIQGALYLIDRALRASPISPADTLQTQVAHESAHLFVAREGAHRPYT